MAEPSTYSKNTLEFLKELLPDCSFEMFSRLQGIASPILNSLFDIVARCYLYTRENTSDVFSGMLSVYNFYLRTQEATSCTSLAIGFIDLLNSLFGFRKIPKLFRLVSDTVMVYFKSINKYFLKSEGLEKSVSTFWKNMEMSDPRSIINIVWELTGVSTTCILLYELYHSGIDCSSLTKLVDTMSTHFLDPRSEIRVRLKDATQALARIVDYIILNFEHIVKCDFAKMTWTLPGPLKFENDFSEFQSLYLHYLENPEILKEKNLTVCNLRDRADKLIKTANEEIIKTNQGVVKSSMVRYLNDLNRWHIYLCEQLNPNNTKPQPMVVTFCGPAGCGKSSLSTNVGKIMQQIAGRIPDEDKIKNRGGDPKFEPAIQSSTEVIISDDFGNDTGRKIPSKEVLDIVNVTREIIPKASVEEKNRHRYSNIGTIFTTNDINLGVRCLQTISYESILRRFGIVVFLEPKSEYCVEGSKVLDRNHPDLESGETKTHIYRVRIRKPIGIDTSKKRKTVIYKDIEDWQLQGHDELQSCLKFLKKFLEEEWTKNVLQHKNRTNKLFLCEHCCLDKVMCICDTSRLEEITDDETKVELDNNSLNSTNTSDDGNDDEEDHRTQYSGDSIYNSQYEADYSLNDDISENTDDEPLVIEDFEGEFSKIPHDASDGSVILSAESFISTEKYYDYFSRGFSTSTTVIKDRLDYCDLYGQLYLDVCSRNITKVMFQYRMGCLLKQIIQTLWEFKYYLLLVNLYMIISLITCPLFLEAILLIGFGLTKHYNNNTPTILFSFFLIVLGYYEGLGTIMIANIFYPLQYYLWKRNKIRQDLEENYFQRRILIREHYYSRMVLYSTLGASGLIFLGLGFFKVISFYFSKDSESKRDITEDPYLPEFKPTNNDDKSRYFFVAKPELNAISSSRSDAINFISKKLLVVSITGQDNFYQEVNGIPSGSEILLPLHALPPSGTFDVEICADYRKRTAAYISRAVPQDNYRQLIDRNGNPVDAVLLNLPNIPTQADLFRYFTSGQQPVEGPGQEIYKKHDGDVEVIDLRLTTPTYFDIKRYSDNIGRVFDNYPALKCLSQARTSESGMCGSPVTSENSNCILGIHVAGNQQTQWYSLRITKDMIDEARDRLKSESRAFISHPLPAQFSVMRENLKGFTFTDVSPSLAVNAIGEDLSPIEEIGMVELNGQPYVDRAQKHYFTNTNPKLEEAFGPRTTQPPKFLNGEEQINSTLKKLNKPKFDVPIDLIDRAAEDYLENARDIKFNSIIQELKSDDSKFFTVRSIEEACQGDNTGIVRGMNNKSSAGWIYGGKKTTHYDMEVEGDPLEIRKLLSYVQKDIESQEMEWRNGRGTFDPFKRSSKANELLPWQKAMEKTRSFYGNDMTFFINSTRGIIPLKHVLRKDMNLSECFVGITPQSSQWRELKDHLSQKGKYDNFVCGDFSGYDTQLPKALLDKAAWILMEMAKRGGMCKSDLEFLRGSLSSIVSPTLFWQGHILRMANGQPSGQPLTVEINSIVNSLLMRMVFYVIMDENYPHLSGASFRDYVALATYGDDNAMGVDERIPAYNHTAIQGVFQRWGISYTMADKNADSIPYVDIDNVSFLKRVFRKHPELGIVAPIEKESITKCFYYWVRPANTPLTFPQQFCEYVKSQVREAALHGEEYYKEFSQGIALLQEGSMEMNPEFHIKWNQFIIPPYHELIEDLRESY